MVTWAESQCDTFRLSTCQQTFICFLPTTLLATHESYGSAQTHHFLNLPQASCRNRVRHSSDPIKSFLHLEIEYGCPFLVDCDLFPVRTVRLPLRTMVMSLLTSASRNTPMMSMQATLHPSCVLITAVMNTNPIAIVGNAVSCFNQVPSFCFTRRRTCAPSPNCPSSP